MWKHFFFRSKHEKCKLFVVALVLNCFGSVFSRPVFNKHFRKAAIKNIITIDELTCTSKIVRNRAVDCCLWPEWGQMAMENTVSSDF